MDLEIFDVGHGVCALLTCDNGSRIMFDCGHNGDTGWLPGTHLRRRGIGSIQLLSVTNFDEDHVSGIENLYANVAIERLFGNPTVDAGIIKTLKTRDGMGPGIDYLCSLMRNVFTGGAAGPYPVYQGLERSVFFNAYPTFDDENNLSVVNFLQCHGIGIMFTGDLECDGWLALLRRDPSFKAALQRTNILIAPHHGRENGCCEEAMKLCTALHCVVISDKEHMYDTQQTGSFYRRFTNGCNFRGARRHILSTRKDGTIGISINANGWTAQQRLVA